MGNERKPWLDSNGNALSEKDLRKVSKSWSPRQWETYLQELEVPQQEVLLQNYERIAHRHDLERSMNQFYRQRDTEQNRTHHSQPTLSRALLSLSYKQRRIIELVVIKEHTLTEAAEFLGITPQPAGRLLKKSLERLKALLEPKEAIELESDIEPFVRTKTERFLSDFND